MFEGSLLKIFSFSTCNYADQTTVLMQRTPTGRLSMDACFKALEFKFLNRRSPRRSDFTCHFLRRGHRHRVMENFHWLHLSETCIYTSGISLSTYPTITSKHPFSNLLLLVFFFYILFIFNNMYGS